MAFGVARFSCRIRCERGLSNSLHSLAQRISASHVYCRIRITPSLLQGLPRLYLLFQSGFPALFKLLGSHHQHIPRLPAFAPNSAPQKESSQAPETATTTAQYAPHPTLEEDNLVEPRRTSPRSPSRFQTRRASTSRVVVGPREQTRSF
jgi:hypothetical protein